jgi:hypothetical protein
LKVNPLGEVLDCIDELLLKTMVKVLGETFSFRDGMIRNQSIHFTNDNTFKASHHLRPTEFRGRKGLTQRSSSVLDRIIRSQVITQDKLEYIFGLFRPSYRV